MPIRCPRCTKLHLGERRQGGARCAVCEPCRLGKKPADDPTIVGGLIPKKPRPSRRKAKKGGS